MSKTARWIRHTHLFRADNFECSACGGIASRPHDVCPRCHTPMKGTRYDPSWVDEMETLDAMFDD